MKTYYLFSGFDTDIGFTPKIADSLRSNITTRKSLVFISSCPYGHEKTDKYVKVNAGWFNKIGIEFDSFSIIDDRINEDESKRLIKNASCIFLCGGTTLLQIELLRKYDLIKLLKAFDGIVIGISAGAINMAINSFYSKNNECENSVIYEGIGLVDITVKPHFNVDNIELLNNEIVPFSNNREIYAMYDNSAIVVQNNKLEYIGDIYFISCGKIAKISSNR